MRIIFSILILISMLIISCGKEESKLQTFNPEAFAYDLGDSWEVNAIVNVKGFEQRENSDDGNFEASLSYSADLKSPDGKITENIYSDKLDLSYKEEILDTPIEVQLELDSTYREGTYQIIFNIEDNFTGSTATSFVDFKLED